MKAEIELCPVECGACGGTYAITEKRNSFAMETGGTWHCPYCQVGWGYSKSFKSKVEVLQAEVNAQIDAKIKAIRRAEELEKQVVRLSSRKKS